MSQDINMAIVLAAGRGSGLSPLTESVPKSLIRIGGITILERLLWSFSCLGIEYVVLVVGYLGDMIRRGIGSTYHGMQIHYVENSLYQSSETMMSLWCGREFFYSQLLLVEGNIIIEPVIVHGLIKELPEKARVVLNLYLLEGYKHSEIGEILDISESTSKSQYQRAKRLLKEKLKQRIANEA